jgi:hypothetical protein
VDDVAAAVNAPRRADHARRGRTVAGSLTIAVALGALTGTPADAAVLVTDTPIAAWRVDGVTTAVLVVGDTTYVGGTFVRATAPDGSSRQRANLAAFDTRTGALVEGFRADTNGTVRALASDGATLWVGGSFTTIAGATRHRVAAVDAATGAVRAFNANANSHVYALDVRAGRLFLGGSFSTVRNAGRQRVAAVDAVSGTVDGQWNPSSNAAVYAVRVHPAGSPVYLGGTFTSIGGASRTGVAAVSGTTGLAVAPAFTDTYTGVLGLDVNETGSRLFGAVAGAGNQAAAWNTTTGTRVWRQRADGDVQAVDYHRDTVYFGFHESFGGDITLRLLAAGAANGALDPEFRPTWDRYWGVFALSVTDDTVAVAGDFTRVSGAAAQGLALFPADRPPPPDSVDYLTPATAWRYFDRGVQPGAGWRGAGFDDGGWASGTPQFGYGDGDETTVVSYGPNAAQKYVTTYFRTTFDVDQPPVAATLSLLADDGAVVYLNGAEVRRDNMPAGAITNTTLAASNRSGAAESQLRTFAVDPARLVAGTNTIAVEVHQDARSSSDLSFDLGLEGQVEG